MSKIKNYNTIYNTDQNQESALKICERFHK